MTREEIIQGLQFTIDMFLSDPLTGEALEKPRNDMDKTTIDACKGAIELLTQESCENAINIQAAIDIVRHECGEWKGLAKEIVKQFNGLPPVQPKYNPDEWCKTCKEYDHDKHCCPRYNKVIRNAVEEIKQPKTHWISYWDEEARCYVYKCPECGNKQPFDTKHCWECGARLDVPDMNDGKLSEISTGSESEKT